MTTPMTPWRVSLDSAALIISAFEAKSPSRMRDRSWYCANSDAAPTTSSTATPIRSHCTNRVSRLGSRNTRPAGFAAAVAGAVRGSRSGGDRRQRRATAHARDVRGLVAHPALRTIHRSRNPRLETGPILPQAGRGRRCGCALIPPAAAARMPACALSSEFGPDAQPASQSERAQSRPRHRGGQAHRQGDRPAPGRGRLERRDPLPLVRRQGRGGGGGGPPARGQGHDGGSQPRQRARGRGRHPQGRRPAGRDQPAGQQRLGVRDGQGRDRDPRQLGQAHRDQPARAASCCPRRSRASSPPTARATSSTCWTSGCGS